MRTRFRLTICGTLAALLVLAGPPARGAEPTESQQLERAKDLIADEQWLRAIQELMAAADDPKEKNKDEALFWLAHSQHQARDSGSALETIGRLERGFPKSRWVKPARSLGLEIAQRLGRRDVLWFRAAPPTAPRPAAAPPAPRSPRAKPPAAVAPPTERPPRLPRPSAPPAGEPPPVPPAPTMVAPTPTVMPPVWGSDHLIVDTDLRIQALGSLIKTDAVKVIPILKEIALEAKNPGDARRALFVLAQSGRPEARTTVVEVARTGSEPVRVAAVRELGRLPGPGISNELLEVYTTSGNSPVKYQVVTALGERAATTALMRIAQSEKDTWLRHAAIMTLGQAGGRQQLLRLYARSSAESKRPIITGLFNAQADAELIRIAETESDAGLRQEVLNNLRLLNTPRAQAYLERLKRE
jgi:HEAT repeat protein